MKRSRLIPTLLGALLIVGVVAPTAWAKYTVHNNVTVTETAVVQGSEFNTCGDHIDGHAGWATTPLQFASTYNSTPGTGALYEVFLFDVGENPGSYQYEYVSPTPPATDPVPGRYFKVVDGQQIEAPLAAFFYSPPLVALHPPVPLDPSATTENDLFLYSDVAFQQEMSIAARPGQTLGIKPWGGPFSFRKLSVVDCTPSPVDQTITFDAVADKTLLESGFSISPTASSGLPVSVSSNDPTVCDVSGGTVVLTAPGTCSLKAEQAGNASFNAASAVTRTFVVTKADQTITFDPMKNRWFFLRAVKVPTPTSTSGLPVTLTSVTPTVCNIIRGLVVFRRPGICSLSANQAGNGTYNPAATVTRSFRIA